MNTCSEIANKNPRRRIRRIACFLLCLMLAAGLLPAAATAPDTGEKTVRVGWYESAFNKTDSAGRRSGYAYEYQMKIAAHTGWRYEYVEASWPELLHMLKTGELDAYVTVDSFTEKEILNQGRPVPICKIGSSDFFFAVNKDRPDLLADLEGAMNRIQEENRYYTPNFYLQQRTIAQICTIDKNKKIGG